MKANNQLGQGLTEYIILVLLVAMVSLAAAQKLGKTVQTKLSQANAEINRKFPRFAGDGEGDDRNSNGGAAEKLWDKLNGK